MVRLVVVLVVVRHPVVARGRRGVDGAGRARRQGGAGGMRRQELLLLLLHCPLVLPVLLFLCIPLSVKVPFRKTRAIAGMPMPRDAPRVQRGEGFGNGGNALAVPAATCV